MEIEPEVLECMEDIIKKVVKKEYSRRQYEKHKEKIKQRTKDWRKKNPGKKKQYDQSREGIKSRRISHWKQRGVICDNWNAMYDHYTNTTYCDICRVELSIKKERSATTKCLDHDHTITDRPNFRNILCHCCNVNRK